MSMIEEYNMVIPRDNGLVWKVVSVDGRPEIVRSGGTVRPGRINNNKNKVCE